MNEHEDYFRITKNGDIHTLSDRIPFRWKELMIFTSASFIFLIWGFGLWVGIFIALLTLLGYLFYRFAAWVYYSEIIIDEKSGKIFRLKKILDFTQSEEMISQKFDPTLFEYLELTRSGKTKYLLSYRTHKNNELLILKSKTDKEIIETYITENITVYNNGYHASGHSLN